MREIVLDTETTGLSPNDGDRIVEIGCIELLNHVPTGKVYHQYVNPERDMPIEAERVHGLSGEFMGDAPLIIHNAAFDMGFINAELTRLGTETIPKSRAIDTVGMARRKFPGAQASLDALCRRFGIDLSERDLHGALLDARLLAEVYLELLGGRQHGMDLAADAAKIPAQSDEDVAEVSQATSGHRAPRAHAVSDEEKARHATFLEKIKDPIWLRS